MLGEKLRLARKKAGLSLRALAEKIDRKVSAQAIGKYERGEMLPSSDVLISLAEVMGMPLSFFLSPGGVRLKGLSFRKRAASRQKDLAAVEASVLDHIERYLQIEEILDMSASRWDRPRGCPYRVKNMEEVEGAAIKLRRAWNLGLDPIPNLTELLEERGIKVIMLDLPMSVDAVTCMIDGESRKPVHVIACCKKDRSIERLRFSLAHELGHQVLEVASDLDAEKACNRFAGAFLMPSEPLLPEVGKHRTTFGYAELIEFKRLYGISAAALIVRLKDLGVISESRMKSMFMGPARTWRRSEPEPLCCEDCDERPRRFSRLCYRALAEGLITLSKASELLRLPAGVISERVWGTETGFENACER